MDLFASTVRWKFGYNFWDNCAGQGSNLRPRCSNIKLEGPLYQSYHKTQVIWKG
jgi:hypothetical protein